MLCSDTSGKLPAVKVPMACELARDIAYLLRGIKELGGNGLLTLHIRGGNVESTEITVKRPRKQSA